jgi:hypothetical protein
MLRMMSVLAIVYIPDLGQFCDARLRPVFCGNRAASSLNLGIRGFVTCEEMGIYDDGSISAICWKRGRSYGASEWIRSSGLGRPWQGALSKYAPEAGAAARSLQM